MKNQYLYYLVDTVSETIIGSFWARSEAMAQKMIDSFDFKKANLAPSDVVCLYDPNHFPVYETVSELTNCAFPEFKYRQRVFDFDVVDGKSDK